MKLKDKSFSIKKLFKSFKYAFNGIVIGFRGEQNLLVDFVCSVLVIILGFILHISKLDFICLFIMIGLVFMAELFNTSLEYLVDLVSPEYNTLAGNSKDCAAGAVLVMAIISVVVGGIIFIPRILALL